MNTKNTKNTKNPLTAEILGISKHALQVANRVGKIDFCKPYKVAKFASPVTFNKAAAAVPALKDQGNYNFFVLLDCRKSEYAYRQYVYIIDVEPGRFNIFRNNYGDSISAYHLLGNKEYNKAVGCPCIMDTFHRVSDLEDQRKQTGNTLYIVYQNKALQAPAPKLKVTSNTFKPWMRNAFYYGASALNYDKSGYNIERIRRDLKSRAFNYKREKSKKEVDSIDYSEYLQTLKSSYSELKSLYIKTFASLADSESMAKLNSFDIRSSLIYGLSNIEGFERRNKEKDFKSCAGAETSFNDCKATINKGLEAIKALRKELVIND